MAVRHGHVPWILPLDLDTAIGYIYCNDSRFWKCSLDKSPSHFEYKRKNLNVCGGVGVMVEGPKIVTRGEPAVSQGESEIKHPWEMTCFVSIPLSFFLEPRLPSDTCPSLSLKPLGGSCRPQTPGEIKILGFSHSSLCSKRVVSIGYF